MNERVHRVDFSSRLSYFVEDRLSLWPEFEFAWTHRESRYRFVNWEPGFIHLQQDSRAYSFRLGLNYRLAGALL